jgi:hypothetical protein
MRLAANDPMHGRSRRPNRCGSTWDNMGGYGRQRVSAGRIGISIGFFENKSESLMNDVCRLGTFGDVAFLF